jgi:hypothetical protein
MLTNAAEKDVLVRHHRRGAVLQHLRLPALITRPRRFERHFDPETHVKVRAVLEVVRGPSLPSSKMVSDRMTFPARSLHSIMGMSSRRNGCYVSRTAIKTSRAI